MTLTGQAADEYAQAASPSKTLPPLVIPNSATALPMMSDGRRAGGTARNPGNKTPRKVQWLDSPQPPSDSQSEFGESSHALDEHGRDPAALKELTEALERHQSEKRPPRIHYFPPRQPDPRFPNNEAAQTADPSGIDIQTQGPSTNTTTSPISSGHTTPPRSPDLVIPGHFIRPGETAGLPRSDNLEDAAQRAASRVVRSHTRRIKKPLFSSKRGRALPAHSKTEDPIPGHHPITSRDFATVPLTQDVENIGPSPTSVSTGMGGVLSALLSLYDDGRASGYSTPGYTSSVSPRPSFERVSTMEERTGTGYSSTKVHSRDQSTESSSTTPSDSATPSRKRKNRQSPTAKILSALDLATDSRPPQARNAGGVIGTLIASTGNITGAAAPIQSQLQPNVKRPGYHLSRYSHENVLPKLASLREEQDADSVVSKKSPKGLHLGNLPKMDPSTANFDDKSPSDKPLLTDKSSPNSPAASWMGGFFKDLPSGMHRLASSVVSTPGSEKDDWLGEKPKKMEEKRKRGKRKEAEIFITRHVAQILARQEFICKLARAMMMFGAPSHRLQPQIHATARVLEIEMSCMYLPDLMLLSFDDNVTSTSNIKLIRQGSSLDLTKLDDAYHIFRKVIHDEVSVSEASNTLDHIMKSPQIYRPWQLCIFGGLCSAAICIVGFSGSFIDAAMAFPMGVLLVSFQLLSVRNELYSNIFEITVATVFSFICAALASTKYFCYSAMASASVVLILPGFIVTLGSLELISRNMISGSVRLCYAVVYSLFLGFGLAMGAQAFEKITSKRVVKFDDLQCVLTHKDDGPWYMQTPSEWWYFLAVPMFALFLSMRNFASWKRKEIFLLVLFACAGWVTNHFISPYFPGQSDVSAAVGAFAVGFISNVYARAFNTNAFVVMITGILFQVPSGLGNGGLLNYAEERSNTDDDDSTRAYISGFQTALQLISVAIGLAIGLSLSLFVVHPIPSRRLRGGVFSL